MTILPKKKIQKEKSDNESHDPQPPRSPPCENRAHANRKQSSPPPRWNSPGPIDDRLGVPDSGGGNHNNRYDDAVNSTHKKRLRSSPHRTGRKHRHSERPIPPHNRTTAVWVGETTTASHSAGAATACRPSHNINDSARTYRQVTATVTSQEHKHCVSAIVEDPVDEEEGYNSEDEYVPQALKSILTSADSEPQTLEEMQEYERCFETELKKSKGFIIKRMGEDGACLFRAVADQVYGDQEMHSTCRKLCVDYMAKNADYYRDYVTEDFNTYLNRKRMDNCHGNHVEIQALSEIYNRPIEIYQYSTEPINTFHGSYKTDNVPIRLSYHGRVHYNSVIDPYKASIGVGLGLPGLQPGLAEKNLMSDAMLKSEQGMIEHAMLEDKLRETDWEVTQEELNEQVARESYIQWLCDQEKNRDSSNQSSSASAACSSSTSGSQNVLDNVPTSPDYKMCFATRNSVTKSASNSAHNSPVQNASVTIQDLENIIPLGTDSVASPQSRPLVSENPVDNLVGDYHSSDPSTSELGAEGGVPDHMTETSSLMNDFNPAMYGLSDWNEDDIMTQILAQSRQEYLSNLKEQQESKKREKSTSSFTSNLFPSKSEKQVFAGELTSSTDIPTSNSSSNCLINVDFSNINADSETSVHSSNHGVMTVGDEDLVAMDTSSKSETSVTDTSQRKLCNS